MPDEKQFQNTFVLTNVCPLCETVLKTRVVAVNHFQRSIQQGRCIGKSRDVHPVVPFFSLTCPHCPFVGDTLALLHAHFRDHHFEFVQEVGNYFHKFIKTTLSTLKDDEWSEEGY